MSECRMEILKQYKERKITSAQAMQKLKGLDRENTVRHRKKKTGGKRK